MNYIKSQLLLVAVVSILFSCKEGKRKGLNVKHSGSLKTIMSGDIGATVKLDSLSKKINLYALGAMENLDGEIQVFNGKPFISSVVNDSVIVNSSFEESAALLVYTQIDNWKEIAIPSSVSSEESLVGFLGYNGKAIGVNIEEPFPFLLEGTVKNLDWHVIQWNPDETLHTHQKHKEAGLNGSLTQQNIQILGFYSTAHKGIFTHHTTPVHMHFKTEDGLLAGHVDNLVLGDGMILKLPGQEK